MEISNPQLLEDTGLELRLPLELRDKCYCFCVFDCGCLFNEIPENLSQRLTMALDCGLIR